MRKKREREIMHQPEQVEALVKQLKPALDSLYKQVHAQFTLHQGLYAGHQQAPCTRAALDFLDKDYMLSKKTLEAYHAWNAAVGSNLSNPQVEFCLQTTYMLFARIFFVRACEEYGLISPLLFTSHTSTPGTQSCALPSRLSATYFQLLKQIYQRAGSEHDHPFYQQDSLLKFYDWFTADEQTILTLYTLLNC